MPNPFKANSESDVQKADQKNIIAVTDIGVHRSQRIKLKYHKNNCFGPDYVVATRHNGKHDRIASGPNRKEDLLKSKVVR